MQNISLVSQNAVRCLHLNWLYQQFKISYRFLFFVCVFFMIQGTSFVYKTLFKKLTSYVSLGFKELEKQILNHDFTLIINFWKQKEFLQKWLSIISRICSIIFENRKVFYRKGWVWFQEYVLLYLRQNPKKYFFRQSHVYFHLNKFLFPYQKNLKLQ